MTRNAYRVLTVWMLLLMASYLLERWSTPPPPAPSPLSDELRQENLLLRSELERTLQRDRLEDIGHQKYGAFDPVAVTVLPIPDLDPKGRAVVVDRGEQHGIRVGDGVVSTTGLVGRVAKVWGRWSWVRCADDPGFRVTGIAVDRDDPITGSTRTILGGSGELGLLKPLLVERVEPFQVGQLLVTDGSAGYFPVRIVIGRVVEARLPYQDTRIALAAEVKAGDSLLVLAGPRIEATGGR